MTVTILFSLVVALLVLPSLLLLVTPSRKGDTRRFLEESLPGADGEYDSHARETAHRSSLTTDRRAVGRDRHLRPSRPRREVRT
jgi:hypothetical protein